MRKIILTGSALALMSAGTFAQAQQPIEQGYVGANYVFLTYEEDGLSEDFDLGALSAKAGAKFNPYFAAELRAGLGVADESISAPGASLKLELDYLIGAYGVLGLPNESPVYPYVVLGYTKGELTASASGSGGSATISESETDISYGVGANLAATEEVHVNVEYMSYFDKDGAEISGFSVGATILF